MICGLCATFGSKPGPGQGKAFIERVMEAAKTPGLAQSITALLAVRTGLTSQIKEMDRVLSELAHRSQPCRQLMTIPGVGVQTSATFVAAVDEVGRFRQSRAVGADFGLIPRRHPSGEIDWTGRITKQGDSMDRKLLYEAANDPHTQSPESPLRVNATFELVKPDTARPLPAAISGTDS